LRTVDHTIYEVKRGIEEADFALFRSKLEAEMIGPLFRIVVGLQV
jgi:hypothetical protein